MDLKYIPYLVPLLTAAVISIVLSIHGLRRRHAPSAIPFVFLMFFVAQWSLCYAFELGATNLQTKVFWTKLKYLGIVIVPVAWLFFTIKYSGRKEWLKLKKIGLIAIVPLVTLLMVWTNDFHGLFWSTVRLDQDPSFPVQFSPYGPWFWVHTLYSYLLLVFGTILIIRALMVSPYLNRGQAVTLLISVLAPWVGNALSIYDLSPFPDLDLTPLPLL